MKLREFPLLTDQNIHADVATFLRSEGFDVVDVWQAGQVGETDANILTWAVARGRLVITHDADFGTLAVQAGAAFVGIIYLRPGHVGPQPTIDNLRQLLAADPDLAPPFLITVKRAMTGVAIRIRQMVPR